MTTKMLISGAMDVVGKAVTLCGLTLIHSGLGLAYGGYVISSTAYEALQYYRAEAAQARTDEKLAELKNLFTTIPSDDQSNKNETKH